MGLFDERTDRAVENRAGIHEDPLQRDVEVGEERGETRGDVDLVLHVELGALDERVVHAEGGVFAQEIDFVGEDVCEAGDERRPGRGARLLVALLDHSPANGHLFEQRDVLEGLVDHVERAELKHAQRGGQRLHGDDLIAEQRQSAMNRRKPSPLREELKVEVHRLHLRRRHRDFLDRPVRGRLGDPRRALRHPPLVVLLVREIMRQRHALLVKHGLCLAFLLRQLLRFAAGREVGVAQHGRPLQLAHEAKRRRAMGALRTLRRRQHQRDFLRHAPALHGAGALDQLRGRGTSG